MSLDYEEDYVEVLHRIRRSLDVRSRRLLSEFGLTLPQLLVLRKISRGSDVTPGWVARQVYLGQATVAGILDRLEHRELVRRSRDPDDARRVLVVLTSRGHDQLNCAPATLGTKFYLRASSLPPAEQAELVTTLRRVAKMMEAATRPAQGRR